MLWFLLYLFVALQVAAVVIAIVSRVWTLKPEPVLWRGTTVDVAANNVERFMVDIDDSRFAYPTGMFVPDEAADHANGRVVMREENFTSSRGFAVAFGIFGATSRGWARSASGRNAGAEFLALMLMLFLAAMLAGPFVVAAVFDIVYRWAFKSRITADITKHPQIEDAVEIRLEFRGLSALGAASDILRGVTAPARPAIPAPGQTFASAGAAPGAGRTENRFRTVYGSAMVSAIVVAAALTATIDHTPSYDSSGVSYASSSSDGSDGGAEEESSDETGSDETASDETASDDGSTVDDADDERRYTAVGYAITPPEGWVQDRDDEDRGSFSESRWHLRGDGDVFVLVDRSAGYDEPARLGARTVRSGFLGQSGYVEHEFSAGDGDSWVWEFTNDGVRKVDVFSTRCGDGFAVLGAAPEDTFEAHRGEFTAFADSLRADCEADDDTRGNAAAGDETSDGSDESGSVDPPETLVGADQQTYSTDTRTGQMESTVRRHFQARLDGDFEKAFRFYAGPLRDRAGSPSSWAEAGREDGLKSVTIAEVKGLGVTSGRGRLLVDFTTDSAAEGCAAWHARYTLRRVSGAWRMWDTDTERREC